MEPQLGGPIGPDFGLYSGAGRVFAVVGDKDACAGAYAGAHDDGLEQPAHGVFGAVVAGAGVAAAGRAAVLASVDAPECGAVAGAELAIATGVRARLVCLEFRSRRTLSVNRREPATKKEVRGVREGLRTGIEIHRP